MTKPIGYHAMILHSHLPYVLSHGRWPHGMDWLNEAAVETYIPLLDAADRLLKEGVSPKWTIGITPVLCEMLASPTFVGELDSYLEAKIEASETDRRDFRRTGKSEMVPLAEMWAKHFRHIRDLWANRYDRDLIQHYKRLQDDGHIEIITCAATHGYLPLLSEDVSIQAQVKMGIATYRRHFGRDPRGIWLPECAYRPSYPWSPPVGEAREPYPRKGIEDFLSENRINYFIVDSALLKGGQAIGVYIDRFEALRTLWGQFEKSYVPAPENEERSPYRPYLVGSQEGKKPVAVIARDPKTGLQVWSGEHGYPGEPAYLDFHKKHYPGGNRYWSVTNTKADLADKRIYDPHAARRSIYPQALHFAQLVKDVIAGAGLDERVPGLLSSPFDAELFGHWWFEGPRWLFDVVKELGKKGIEPITVSEYLERHPAHTMVSLPEGSWGEGGYHYIWLNEWTEWTWKHVYTCEQRMKELAKKHRGTEDPDIQRLIRQSARENLLLQSSDWQFLISTWSARDYAELRFQYHLDAFEGLANLIDKKAGGEGLTDQDWNYTAEIEERDRLFADINPDWWAELEYEN